MFCKEYIQLILISFLASVPIAYYAVNLWLNNFSNHIQLQWWLFLLPGLMVLGIAIMVISTKSIKAANTNPIDKLKYE
jgi:ABC-type antimicrobial peptide transport system permease subunit